LTISVSEAYNQRNVRMTVAESIGQAKAICTAAGAVPVDGVVSCAFGSPYEGDIEPAAVAALGAQLFDARCTALSFAAPTALAASLVGHPVPSRVALAGPRSRLASA